MRLQELLLPLHLTHIDVRWIYACSSCKHGGLRMDMLVHCSIIYSVTTIDIVLNLLLLLMIRVEVACGSSPSVILWDIRVGVHPMMLRGPHYVVVLRVET